MVCIHRNEEESDNLRKGLLPKYEPGLEEIVRRNAEAGRLDFTTSWDEDLSDDDSVFVAVRTPTGTEVEADLAHVQVVTEEAAKRIRYGCVYEIVAPPVPIT